jgi:antitoxin FitA
MSKMVQIRNVPDELHAELVRRASRHGLTLTDYLQGLLEREVARPTPEELRERLASRRAVELDRPVADIMREERAER